MSDLSVTSATSLPADLRTAPAARQDAYRSALAFEQVLVTQLAETMLPKTEAAGAYAKLMPEALSNSMTAAGGLGLARPLLDAVAPAEEPRS